MTWTLVQKSAAVATSSTGTVTGTLPGGTTAGNPVVAVVGSNVAGTQFTGPANWVQAAQVSNGTLSRSEIWWLPPAANPGGITSAAFVCGTGIVRCALGEFHTDVASPTVSVASSGTGTASTVTTCTASAGSAAGDLAVVSFLEHLGSNSVVAWTDPSGFTLLDSLTASGSNQLYSAYNLSAAGGTLNVTATSSVAAGVNGWTGAIVTFNATGTASQPVAVGATVNTNALPAGTTQFQAIGLWASATGRPVQVQKVFYTLGPVRPNGTVDLTARSIDRCIAAGIKCMLCFSPAFNPVNQAHYDNLNTTLAAYKAAGLVAEVVLWQEPANADKHMSAAQYGAMVEFYQGAVKPYYPLVASLNYVGTSSTTHFTDYFNAPPAGTFAKGYIDFYARAFPRMSLDAAAAACDAQGVPFGISEWGCNPQIDTVQDCIDFMNYVASSPSSFMQTRKANGQLIGDVIWYGGPGPGPGLALPITDPPQPGTTLPGQTTDFRIPLYQAAFDAMTSSGGGTVTVAASLQVLATPSAGATSTGGPAPPPVPPPVPPPAVQGFPELITQLGIAPAPPTPLHGTFILNDRVFGTLNANFLGASTNWTSVSQFVRSFSTSRTSTRQQAPVITYDAGTLTAVLKNDGGDFDPDNLNGQFIAAGQSQIRPMLPVRVQAAFNGIVYPLFSGFADSWATPDTNFGPRYSETTVNATDAFKVLTGFQLGASAASLADQAQLPVGAGEDTGARMTRLLNLAGWDSDDRVIDTGNTLQQGTALAGPDALTEMRLAADTELGELYVRGDGKVVFRRRRGVMEDTRSTVPQAVFGDSPGPGTVLNTNQGFEAVDAFGNFPGWSAQQGATLQQAGIGAFAGIAFCLINPDGVTLNPSMVTIPDTYASNYTLLYGVRPAVTAGQFVTFSAWLKAAAGHPWPMNLTIRFYDQFGGHLNADIKTTVQTSLDWAQAQVSGFVPAGAFACTGAIVMNGTPPVTGYAQGVDEAYLAISPELPYTGLGRANDETQLCNDAQIQAAGDGTALQEAQDSASVATFLFPRSYSRTDLLLQTDEEALEYAQFLVFLSKGAEDRFDSITLNPLRDTQALFPQVLGREIGDMIAVIRRPPGTAPITKQLIIRGISHGVDVSAGTWQTVWQLQDASRYSFLTLGDPLAGRLDNNALAY